MFQETPYTLGIISQQTQHYGYQNFTAPIS